MSYLGIALCGVQATTPLPWHRESHTGPFVTVACEGVNTWCNNPISPPNVDVASVCVYIYI